MPVGDVDPTVTVGDVFTVNVYCVVPLQPALPPVPVTVYVVVAVAGFTIKVAPVVPPGIQV